MEDKNKYLAVRIDDAANWRLTIYISRRKISAYLKNEDDPTEPVATLFCETIECDESELLREIEEAVEYHPQLLDDFSTDIIICTDKVIWVPNTEIEKYGEQEVYNKVYKASEEDIFLDEVEDMTCLYTLVDGLLPFIKRTLPGARTWNQQTVTVRRFIERVTDVPRIFVEIREKEADYIGFDGKRMLFAVTHPRRDIESPVKEIINLAEVFELNPRECQISVSGPRDEKTELIKMLREHFSYVMLTMIPSAVATHEMPQAVSMLVSRVNKKK